MEFTNVQELQQGKAQGAKRFGGKRLFQPGESGNPTAKTLAQRIAVQLTRQFVEVHGRVPDLTETALIGAAATCSSIVQRRSPKVEDADRLNACNSLARALRRLGLADTSQRKRSSTARARDVLKSDDKP